MPSRLLLAVPIGLAAAIGAGSAAGLLGLSWITGPVTLALVGVVGTGTVLRWRSASDRRPTDVTAQRLAAIVDGTDDAILAKTLEGIITDWNPAAERLYGYSSQEAIGRPVTMLVPAHLLDEHVEIMRQLRLGRRLDHLDSQRHRKDGTLVQVSLTISPIRDLHGVIVGASTIARDVTEQRRAEADLRQSREQLEIIFREVAEGITVQRPDGILIYANDAAARMVGFLTGKEMLTVPVVEIVANFEVLAEDGSPLPHDQLPSRRALLGEHPTEMQVRFRVRSTGRERWAEVAATPVFGQDGRVEFAVNVFRDVTERRTAEELQRFLGQVSVLLAASLDFETTLRDLARMVVPRLADWCAVDILADDGSIRRVTVAHPDPAMIELAHTLDRRYPIDPADPTGVANVLRTGRSELYPEIPDELLTAGARDEEHLRIARALGLRSALVVPLTARGRTFGAMTLVYAESGRRYDRQDLDTAEDLAARAALAVDNARLYSQARDAIQARDTFLSVTAHELRTPLATLRAHAQLALRRFDREGQFDPERTAQALVASRQQADKLGRLIDQLLDLTRIELGQLSLTRATCDLAELVREIVAAARLRTQPHPITLRSVDRLDVRVDALRLEQVLTNLLDNAIKYSPSGAVIEVELAAEPGNLARLSVRDHGLGIPPERRGQIFERFFRAHDNSYASGVGIGLFVSRQIAEQHGGRLWAEFPPDGGSRFVLEIPLDPPPPPAPGPANPPRP